MAPSVRYYNQTAPFWDFIASLEEQGITGNNDVNDDTSRREETSTNENERGANPWSEGGWATFPWGPVPHRGRHGPPGPAAGASDPEEGSSQPKGPPPPPSDEKHDEAPRAGPSHAHGHHGPHRGPGSRGGPCSGKGRGGGGGGGWGGRGRGRFHPYASGPFGAFADMFQSQVFGGPEGNENKHNSEDFHPDVDIFDTSESFVVHVSLPGAKKEDVGVNWDAEKSELSIAGVVHRPGDEEFLKTLALDERKVGAFERKVRLGSRANPASIDIDGITARMEDGVLTVEVPKLDAGYVEIKKVDIE
ncbi:uncharacterized protein RCC_05928 [Ramularia collo-cygni]|uniref:SHSP domain-containing protein n=1 Tax=Ramularia collo-cygni TaxID=112498 RepID=A0A2D3UU49_9PEZI|nr:uncharacterized protein RCC_05928 [Ramularia collo-cygni]CZT20071.1 uncharacterized protein RCC_05928 [Ramularia collo-cygni]